METIAKMFPLPLQIIDLCSQTFSQITDRGKQPFLSETQNVLAKTLCQNTPTQKIPCYGLYLDVPQSLTHSCRSGFSEMAGSSVCEYRLRVYESKPTDWFSTILGVDHGNLHPGVGVTTQRLVACIA